MRSERGKKHVNIVDLVKSFPTNIYLQNLASIQKRTSPVKFAYLAEKSGEGSISSLSTKVAPGNKLGLPWPLAHGGVRTAPRPGRAEEDRRRRASVLRDRRALQGPGPAEQLDRSRREARPVLGEAGASEST